MISWIKSMIVKMKEWRTIRLAVNMSKYFRLSSSSYRGSLVTKIRCNSKVGLGSFLNSMAGQRLQIWYLCSSENTKKCLTLFGGCIWRSSMSIYNRSKFYRKWLEMWITLIGWSHWNNIIIKFKQYILI